MVAPIIPGLTDHELERLVEAASRAGASSVGYTLVRLPYDVKDLMEAWLRTHYPQRAAHVRGSYRLRTCTTSYRAFAPVVPKRALTA